MDGQEAARLADPREEANVVEQRPEPVTVVLSRRVRPGKEAAFEELLREIAAAALKYPGHLGVNGLRPEAGGSATYTIVIHFRSAPELAAWTGSAERARLLAEAELLCEGAPQVQELSGLEAWFRLPGQNVILAPPRHEVAVVTWVAITPLTMLLNLLVISHLGLLPVLVRPAPVSAISIVLMTYLVMPLMTRVFRAWLYPKRSPSLRRQVAAPGREPAAMRGRRAARMPLAS